MNHKQMLADFYLKLLSIPIDNPFRYNNQPLYAAVLDAVALELNEKYETVQRIFERMAQEDIK